jgi:pimeloyl-ACP methyl ester carboxylesterase
MALNLETMFFCHGAPGSPQDANLLRTVGNDTQIIAPNMFDLGSGDVVEQMIDAFDRSTSNNDDKPVHVVGFSVGAMVAIKVAAARPDRIGKLTLISAAAPLQLGDFLLDMAGKPVFDLAKDRPRILRLLTSAQSILSTVAPNLLMNQLFGKCGKMEHALLTDLKFRQIIKQGFANSFRQNPNAYISLLQSYVADWSADIPRVSCPVEIWHGTEDTWSPPAMAHALVDVFSGKAHLNAVPKAEHYSTLAMASLEE